MKTENENMNLWNKAFKTSPSAVKPITGKQYQGNSPKPYWIVQRITELLGPCGIGWGMTIVNERFERLTDTDVLHVALVRFWYVLDDQRGELEQMGQTKATYMTSKGSVMVDEDAPKKSVTDALVKCASYLGFAGDIFSGRWDDSKYVNELREEAKRAEFKSTRQELAEEATKSIPDERQEDLRGYAASLIEFVRDAKDVAAYELYTAFTDSDEKLFIWNLIDKPTRGLLKTICTNLAKEDSKAG
jgi:hypothetical protein